jgi:isopentenyl-diphosphate delta-isomerase
MGHEGLNDDASIDQQAVISGRKADHIALCASGAVEFRSKSTLLDQIDLIHEALPDRHFESVDLGVELLGHQLSAPIVISAMTGGTPEAERINRDLAQVAERLGLGFGLGSQRAMVLRPETARTYAVRDVAPTALLLGNIGLVQARAMSTAELARMVEGLGADALCVHLNPAMELVQPGGDRDFSEGSETIERLVRELPCPVVVKETGCGLSRPTGERLRELGVRCIDVSGAGGTSWVAVESKRVRDEGRGLGSELWDWGIPTAISVAVNADLGFQIIATGGLRSGTDAAKALALGASAAGFAAPVLRAHKEGGLEGAAAYLRQVIHSLRAIAFLSGCQTVRDLRRCPKVVSGVFTAWMTACSGPRLPVHRIANRHHHPTD